MSNNRLQSIKNRFGIIGNSEGLNNALATAVRVANTDLSVLITGESGVGKEVFSKIIHELSPRKHNNFIAVNCGAIPAGTINSELLGHEKGAFTGATTERKGYFETVNGGTIFLDEIGEMPLDTQAFLLRVLESGEFLRVGSSKVQRTDVRVVAATNVNLRANVRNGKFREDLYYRLSTVPIQIPPLRERPGDIAVLFRKFAGEFAERYRTDPIRLDDRAELVLESYSWPGNIRELKNLAEQLSVMSESRTVEGVELIDRYPHLMQRNLPAAVRNGDKEDLSERDMLYKVLFEMKRDMTDLKSLVYGLIQNNDLAVPDVAVDGTVPAQAYLPHPEAPRYAPVTPNGGTFANGNAPVYFQPAPNRPRMQQAEEVDESLDLAEMERKMIVKALKKNKNRRRDAAADLGISERTLYRKIKEYELV